MVCAEWYLNNPYYTCLLLVHVGQVVEGASHIGVAVKSSISPARKEKNLGDQLLIVVSERLSASTKVCSTASTRLAKEVFEHLQNPYRVRTKLTQQCRR